MYLTVWQKERLFEGENVHATYQLSRRSSSYLSFFQSSYMKHFPLLRFIPALVLLLAGCDKEDGPASCWPNAVEVRQAPVVKQVVNAEGIVWVDDRTGEYFISSATSMDSADSGFVCENDLPKSLRIDGQWVVFSGTYKAKETARVLPVGYKDYYLELATISAR